MIEQFSSCIKNDTFTIVTQPYGHKCEQDRFLKLLYTHRLLKRFRVTTIL
jgi:hypothetical protein